ncbi:hypothetical protein RxyAA322_00720 [Rubrobacter xylanophilus]|uniref:Ribonuclease n=1 Tax=Rubrobacter xylanophilus TaxID=49319 RepID=A0A510HE63_9ACTN|nr:hypothetical protein [Rubrobacter xylanophilus]BBL78218.1 hypothetical protein RxyAA322_00720 [Rubrobacter xylanophilus]
MSGLPENLRRYLEEHGVEVAGSRRIDHGTQYRLVRGSEEATLNVYDTGRVLEGGRATGLRELLRGWREGNQGAPARRFRGSAAPGPNPLPRIGIDEAGKGEYLGPLVVAGVRLAGAAEDLRLRELGVRDSKALNPERVLRLAGAIREELGGGAVCVISLAPREYERRRRAAGGNVNRLLAELNLEITESLMDGTVRVVVVDSFGERARSYIEGRLPPGLRLEVRPRAEDDVAVAAASVLARARYLEEMEELSRRLGVVLPRGSSERVLEVARRVYEERGEEGLAEIAKLHFATTGRVVSRAER